MKIIVGWLALHEEEVYAAWNKAVQGEHFDKVDPMQGIAVYVVDDICYAGSPAEEIRIVEAKPLQGGMLLVRFASGEKRLFDTTAIEGPAFEPLRQGIAQETVSVFHGFLTQLDRQIDLTPEYVYEYSIVYDEVPEEFGYCQGPPAPSCMMTTKRHPEELRKCPSKRK